MKCSDCGLIIKNPDFCPKCGEYLSEPACLVNGNHDWELQDIDIEEDEDGRTMIIKNVEVCFHCGKMR